ncbi:solute carrier family 13 member 2-like [Aplochiton taeniatus]
MAGCLKWFWCHRNYLIVLIVPLLLLPLPLLVPTQEAKCGFVIILMALYWCTECMPLAVTALLPVLLFPTLGIMKSSQVCFLYINDSTMLGVGGLFVAITVEHHDLHKRIALKVALLVGVRPALLMMGFMAVTAFLSMWISNVAVTAMMLPIAQAVLQQLATTEAKRDQRELEEPGGKDNTAFQMENKPEVTVSKQEVIKVKTGDDKRNDTYETPDVERGEEDSPSDWRRKAREAKFLLLTKGMSLGVCYSASIGGTATLTGTAPNIILKGQLDQLFPGNGGVINFASWFGFAFPNMIIMLLLSWLWLQFMYMGFNMKKSFGCGTTDENDEEAFAVMEGEYRKLGPMTFAQGSVLTIFVLLVVMWFTREPGFMPGWAMVLFNQDGQFVTDGTVSIFVSMLFFIIPSQRPRFWCCGRVTEDEEGKVLVAPSSLLTWKVIHERMPWNIMFLLGGSFALARGSEVSGLSMWVGEGLSPIKSIPPFAISLLMCLLVGTLTEFTSNVATTTLLLPILASLATAIELHPLYVMLPCTVSASLAFMLPVATPPNAIAFSYGNLKVLDMVKAGFMLNLIGILSINFGINTWGDAMFKLNTFPSWANVTHGRNL